MVMKINGLYLTELTPNAVVGGCINIYENAWKNPEETILAIEKECSNPNVDTSWTKAHTTTSGPYQDDRTNKMLDLTHACDVTNSPTLQTINNQFYTLILSSTNSYAKQYGIGEPLWHEGYQILKYSDGQEYKPHYDGGTWLGRAISAIVYLNADFEGGELEFVNFGIKIKPQPGMLILFPSNYAYTHIAHPVVSGAKYAIVTWVKDRQM